MTTHRTRLGLKTIAALVIVLGLAAPRADATRFGRNKVQYREFGWRIVQTEHFDVYFYEGSEDLADAAGRIAEEANAEFESVLDHELSTVIPVIVYASHNDFQQTNISLSHVEESVGGFTELFKNRVVVPFTGSYADLRHVLYHELTHVFMFDIVYGGLVESVIRQAYLNPVPLWFVEGLAEYVSTGWDPEAEMILRDLTVSDMVIPLEQLYGGYLVYKEGQSALNFIAERYGREKIAEIVRYLASSQDLDRALKRALGLMTPELSQEWETWLRRRYWPEVADKRHGSDVAKLLTNHLKDQSYFNIGPELSPDGKKVAFLSDKSGYATVYVASTLDGAILRRLVEGERSREFETLHVLRPGFSWSPDGREICFVAKAGGGDALHFVDAETGKLLRSFRFPLDGMFTPSWSPEGDKIVFVGTLRGGSDLYLTDAGQARLVRLTDDFYDEREPTWSPDGRVIAFASDRDSPARLGFARTYDIYALNVETGKVEAIVATEGDEASPAWSPDGTTLAYTSDKDGTLNVCFANLRDSTSICVTNLIGGAAEPSWSLDGSRLAFALYGEGGWDIAVVKDPLDHFSDAIASARRFVSVPREPAGVGPVTSEIAGRGTASEELRVIDEGFAVATPDRPPETAPGEPGEETEVASDEESETVRLARDAYREAAAAPRDRRQEEREKRRPGDVEPYRPRFSPDWVNGGFSYSSAYGFGGNAEIAVSDILGNHRFYLATDVFSSIEANNFVLQYDYLARRTNYSFAVYSFKEYYYSERTRLGEDLGEKRYFSERSYGFSCGATYPFSKFSRVEFDVSGINIERRFAEETETGDIELTDEEVSRTLLVPSVRLVNDTTLWGWVGPISGGRSSVVLSKAAEMGGDFEYLTLIGDIRRYVRMGARHSLALKLVAARSSRSDAQNFYLGGVNSLRGYDDFEFNGRNLALLSVEFRYPFIDHLKIASPIPFSIWGLRGILFADLGAAWDEDFRGVVSEGGVRFRDIKTSYGFGIRTRLGVFVIRLDRAWPYDLQTTGEPRTHFALGAEF